VRVRGLRWLPSPRTKQCKRTIFTVLDAAIVAWFALWTKTLEKEKFRWPKNLFKNPSLLVNHLQLTNLLSGMDISNHKKLVFKKKFLILFPYANRSRKFKTRDCETAIFSSTQIGGMKRKLIQISLI
jgi:hypothetical protein